MKRIAYYFFLKPLSLLPLPVLYAITWPLYLLLAYVFRYRSKVMRMNLANSFPEKSAEELRQIEKKFYRHFFDQILESVHMISMGEAEFLRRMKMVNPEVLTPYYDEGRSVAMVIGHYNNWEFTPSINRQMKHQFVAIYSVLRNKFFNEVVKKARSKLDTKLLSRNEVGAFIRKPPKEPFLLVFAADQSPNWKSKLHWTEFLNQKTGVATGAERYAQMLNWVVVFGHITKVKRGTYEITIEVLTDKPKELPEGEITEMHVRALERQILKAPQYWLWTHKRWKKKTEQNLEL